MRRPIEWGWLAFTVVFCAAGVALLWFGMEAVNGW